MADAELKLRVKVDGTDDVVELARRLNDGKLNLNEIVGFKKGLNEVFREVKTGTPEFSKLAYVMAQINDKQRDVRIETKAGHEEYFKLGLELRQAAIQAGGLSGATGQLVSSLSSGTSAALGISSALKPLGIQMGGMSTGILSLAMALPPMLETVVGFFRTTGFEIASTNREMEHNLQLQVELGTKTDRERLEWLEKTAASNREKAKAASFEAVFIGNESKKKEEEALIKQAEEYETEAARIRKRLKDKDQKDAEDAANKAVRQEERRQTAVASVIKNEFDRRAALTKLQFEKEIKDAGDNKALRAALEQELAGELEKIDIDRTKREADRVNKLYQQKIESEQFYQNIKNREDAKAGIVRTDIGGHEIVSGAQVVNGQVQGMQFGPKAEQKAGPNVKNWFDFGAEAFQSSAEASFFAVGRTFETAVGGAIRRVFGQANSLLAQFAMSAAEAFTSMLIQLGVNYVGAQLGIISPTSSVPGAATSVGPRVFPISDSLPVAPGVIASEYSYSMAPNKPQVIVLESRISGNDILLSYARSAGARRRRTM